MVSYALMQFLASPILGALSDQFGRRPILLVSLLFAGFDYIIMAFAPTLTILFLGRIVSGATGASATVAAAYIGDISDDTNRSYNFGLIGAAWGIGFIIGPLLGGCLAVFGTTAPFLVAASMNLLNFLFGWFILPESLKLSLRRTMQLKNLNPFQSLWNILKPSPYIVLIWIYILVCLIQCVHPVNWTLYSELKFHWSAFEVGLSLTVVGVSLAFCQLVLMKRLIPKLGERTSLTLSLVIYAICSFLFAFSSQTWMVYATILLYTFTGLALPIIQGMLGKHVAKNKQGELQGSLMAFWSLASVVTPLLYTPIFITFTKKSASLYFPGAAYFTAGLLGILACLIWIRALKKNPYIMTS